MNVPDFPGGLARHVVFSPEQERAVVLVKTASGVRELKNEALRVVKASGLIDGAIMYHERRVTEYGKSEWRGACGRGDADKEKGVWDWLYRVKVALDDEYTYVSPHFHVIGYGFMERSDLFSTRTGWVYKNVRDLVRYAEIGQVAFYLLSHCSGQVGGRAISYYGLLWRLSGRCVRKDSVPEECDKCGSDVVEWGGVTVAGVDELGVEAPDLSGAFPMLEYVVIGVRETWRYWMRGFPGVAVEVVTGSGVVSDRGPSGVAVDARPPGVTDGCAYDWSHDEWINSRGEVVA